MSFGRVLSIVLLVGTAIGLFNVYSDNAGVVALAKDAACGGRACDARVTRQERSPLGQSFTFQTRLIQKGKVERNASVDVECARAYFLVGEYACRAHGALP